MAISVRTNVIFTLSILILCGTYYFGKYNFRLVYLLLLTFSYPVKDTLDDILHVFCVKMLKAPWPSWKIEMNKIFPTVQSFMTFLTFISCGSLCSFVESIVSRLRECLNVWLCTLPVSLCTARLVLWHFPFQCICITWKSIYSPWSAHEIQMVCINPVHVHNLIQLFRYKTVIILDSVWMLLFMWMLSFVVSVHTVHAEGVRNKWAGIMESLKRLNALRLPLKKVKNPSVRISHRTFSLAHCKVSLHRAFNEFLAIKLMKWHLQESARAKSYRTQRDNGTSDAEICASENDKSIQLTRLALLPAYLCMMKKQRDFNC